MLTAIILSLTASAFAQPTNLRVSGVTHTQAVVRYTSPDSAACTFDLSESVGLTPLAKDADESLFSGANSDARAGSILLGRERVIVLGKKTVETALDGRNYSRALKESTTHHLSVACTGGSATAQFTTVAPPTGSTVRDPMLIHPTEAGKYIWQSISYTNRDEEMVDPQTGALIKRMSMPFDQRVNTGLSTAAECALGTGWVDTSPCLALSGGISTYAGTAQQPLAFLGCTAACTGGGWTNFNNSYATDPKVDVDAVRFNFLGNCVGLDCSTTEARDLGVCWTYGGTPAAPTPACDGPWAVVNLPNASEALYGDRKSVV